MFEMFDISFNGIEIIKDLWEKNRQYHENNSTFFGESYRTICFEDKVKDLAKFHKDKIKISVAKVNDEYIGYCISTIVDDNGEIASIHVDQSSRRVGIGKKLVVEYLEWMKGKKCKAIGVTVSQENKSTINFYKELGFYPNTLFMQQNI
ncbi:GNAT family N-acetyltransferase [Gudongella sp. DL1XJH-153]|uniref:GNAT family N-acetyltransferase n=1 Tax=Gudongella sp. DL1XJH-153 TaxID=3409804 RepID=UPI003BB77B3B